MRIVELTDYTMVIMKDSEDPPWISVGRIYRHSKKLSAPIRVALPTKVRRERGVTDIKSKDAVYNAGMLVLFFDNAIKGYSVQDRVDLYLYEF